ncbi:MAG TPA: toast rack family protein [Candidatus Acidoferrum sp.]|nr:toast rack family protein [Candidatus Acidoferrum sp.]
MSARYLFTLPGALFLAACTIEHNAGPLQYDSQTVEADGAESAHVALHMGAGEMRVTDGASQLARADFSYNVPDWKPIVRYTKNSKRGDLTIEQPKGAKTHFGNSKYTWEVQLSNKIPMELEIHFGAGQARLDVGSLDLRGVEIHMGVGQVDLDLRGHLKHSYNVALHGGVGEATVRVPSDAGVYAEASGGIGSINVHGLRKIGDHWESESYSKAENKLRLEVHGGIGEIKIIAD